MTTLSIDHGYPLSWPDGRPRTTPLDRRAALWRKGGERLTLAAAERRLREQLGAMTKTGQIWRTTSVTLSSNIRFTLAGTRDRNVSRSEPADTGAALYFDLDERPHVLACDRWTTVADNVAAIAAHIEALRGQERWGVADLAQAFAGHARLAAPTPWWVVLGVGRDASDEDLARAYRARAKATHPDAGGDRAGWDQVNSAIEAARRERGA